MIDRKRHVNTVLRLLKGHRIVGILGARQVGKTTLARVVQKQWKGQTNVFDLENPEDLARLNDPILSLKNLKGLVILDEIQRRPDLYNVLRVLVDRPGKSARFLVLGSASPNLLMQSSESLAGRIIYYNLPGFSLDETGIKTLRRLWFRGGFPRSYLARSHAESHEWRCAFIQTFLERDMAQMGIRIGATTLRRFWNMLAHYHGNIWNSSEFARSFGVADTTVRNYLDLLTDALVIRQLQPWHENISKRQVKSPKVYVLDSGLLHSLLRLGTPTELESHPKLGASWEGFILEELIKRLGARAEETFFWATHSGAELDLLVVRGKKRWGFEIKRTSTPGITRSIRQAMKDIHLESLHLIHAGEKTFLLSDNILAVSFQNLLENIKPL